MQKFCLRGNILRTDRRPSLPTPAPPALPRQRQVTTRLRSVAIHANARQKHPFTQGKCHSGSRYNICRPYICHRRRPRAAGRRTPAQCADILPAPIHSRSRQHTEHQGDRVMAAQIAPQRFHAATPFPLSASIHRRSSPAGTRRGAFRPSPSFTERKRPRLNHSRTVRVSTSSRSATRSGLSRHST